MMRTTGETTAAEPVELLAGRINAAHQAVERAMRDVVARAVEAGNLLAEAKKLVGHGGWESWLEANCTCSVRTAQAYMRLARELPKLDPAKAQRVADLSLREALAAVASDARDARALPGPLVEEVLEAAPADGLRRPLKQAANLVRHRARHAAPAEQDRAPEPDPPVWIPGPPVSPHRNADPTLARALLALCRERAALDPGLAPEVVCETLNAVYCEIQDNGLSVAAAPAAPPRPRTFVQVPTPEEAEQNRRRQAVGQLTHCLIGLQRSADGPFWLKELMACEA